MVTIRHAQFVALDEWIEADVPAADALSVAVVVLKALIEVARVTVLTVPSSLGSLVTASTLATLFGTGNGTATATGTGTATVQIILTPDPNLLDAGDTIYALVNPTLVTFGRPPAGRFCERIWRIFSCRNALVRGQCGGGGVPNVETRRAVRGAAKGGTFEKSLREIREIDRKAPNVPRHGVKPRAETPKPIDPARCDKLFGKGQLPQHGNGPIHTEEIPDCAAPRPISEWEYANDGWFKCRNGTHWLSGCLRYHGDG